MRGELREGEAEGEGDLRGGEAEGEGDLRGGVDEGGRVRGVGEGRVGGRG